MIVSLDFERSTIDKNLSTGSNDQSIINQISLQSFWLGPNHRCIIKKSSNSTIRQRKTLIKSNFNEPSQQRQPHTLALRRCKFFTQPFIEYYSSNHSKSCRQIYFHRQIHSFLLLILFVLLSPSFVLSLPPDCRFPDHWRGQWFQKGVSEPISIHRFNISEKGVCRKNFSDKFIIENRAEKCVRCLVINERHPNILQYKETNYCYPISEMSLDICSDINGDAPLFLLFRVNTPPIKCPFQGPYTFSYSKGILNECKDPMSVIDECTDDRHMLFKFRACTDIPGSESKVEELECIGQWKESNYKYLVGKLNHKLATTDEDRFRCFVIERNYSDPVESYNIGQSGDASCEGLYSPRDGSRTFKLYKTNPVEAACDFPHWLTAARQWSTLDNRYLYDFSSRNQFSVFNEQKNQIVHRLTKCLSNVIDAKEVMQQRSSSLFRFNTSRFIVHTTEQCNNGYACLQIYQRENRIVELQIGNIVSQSSEACAQFNLRTTNFITLTTLDQETRPCNLRGLFSIKTKSPYGHTNNYNGHHHYHKIPSNYSRQVSLIDSRFVCQEKDLKLKSNCDDLDQFQFICSTDNRVKNFRCRGGWQENNTQYFLVSFIEKFNYEYCIAHNIITNEIRLIRNSHFCSRETSMAFGGTEGYGSQPSGFYHPSPSNLDFQSSSKQKYVDFLSFTLVKEGACQRSSSRHPNDLDYLLLITSLIYTIHRIFFSLK